MTTAALVGGADFSVSRTIGAGDIMQSGFMTTGLVADPATVFNLGYASIQAVPEPSTLGLVALFLLLVCARTNGTRCFRTAPERRPSRWSR